MPTIGGNVGRVAQELVVVGDGSPCPMDRRDRTALHVCPMNDQAETAADQQDQQHQDTHTHPEIPSPLVCPLRRSGPHLGVSLLSHHSDRAVRMGSLVRSKTLRRQRLTPSPSPFTALLLDQIQDHMYILLAFYL